MRHLEKVFSKNKDMVERKIDKELILVPIFKSDKDINELYSLNEVASDIWEFIDGKRSVAQIKSHILKKYDVDGNKLDKYLTEFLGDLQKIKAID